MSLLQPYIDLTVLVTTIDGRVLVGKLIGTDQTSNIILQNCNERVFSAEGTEIIPLGLFLLRGDNVCTIGEIDTEKEETINFADIRADPLQEVVL
ncbi:uncharacterized protein B0P05DRAFT_523884 [Gilbertella persicaria]|uniref:uncharacterized protein n=1 Tax=Gilbertella persicaria TaxID=101096 RepID=UPI00221E60A7|nr:uncharacterized protein B0P05DRAFT_523884 [Gilbertella persicaria]KAI8094903.1 hypothetical protein B0P05DRAFT_523884 [Gilbertella persicaria]